MQARELEDAPIGSAWMVLSRCTRPRSSSAASALKSPLIGINNRDLRTFETDSGRRSGWRAACRSTAIAVSETGIATRQDLAQLARSGFAAS